MDYNDDDSIEERGFKLGDDGDENFSEDIDGPDIPEEPSDFEDEEESLLDQNY